MEVTSPDRKATLPGRHICDLKRTLTVGCGANCCCARKNREWEITVDIDPNQKPTLVFDMASLSDGKKLPFSDGYFEKIRFEGVAFHIKKDSTYNLFKELLRIGSKTAKYDIDFFTPGSYRHQGCWTNLYGFKPFISFEEVLQLHKSDDLSKLRQLPTVELDSDGNRKV
jgi:hypothetical protein